MSVEIQTVKVNQTNKKDPVKTGAKIGAGTTLGLMGASFLYGSHKIKEITGDGFFKTMNKGLDEAIAICGGNKRIKNVVIASNITTAIFFLIGVSTVFARIGAGIGKLVKNHNDKKEAEKQNLAEQIKVELENQE